MRRAGLTLVLFAGSLASAAPPGAEALRHSIQKGVAPRTPAERATALDVALRDQDSADAADIAVDAVFGADESQLVLDVAISAVGRMKDAAVVPVLRKAADAGPLVRRIRAI